jgi:hypothetical protein
VGSVTRQIVGVPRSWRREQGLSRLHLGAGTDQGGQVSEVEGWSL